MGPVKPGGGAALQLPAQIPSHQLTVKHTYFLSEPNFNSRQQLSLAKMEGGLARGTVTVWRWAGPQGSGPT